MMNFIKISIFLFLSIVILNAAEPKILGEFDRFCSTQKRHYRVEIFNLSEALTPENLVNFVVDLSQIRVRIGIANEMIEVFENAPNELKAFISQHTAEMITLQRRCALEKESSLTIQSLQTITDQEQKKLTAQNLTNGELFKILDREVMSLGVSPDSCTAKDCVLILEIAKYRAAKRIENESNTSRDVKFHSLFLGSVIDGTKEQYPHLHFLFGERDKQITVDGLENIRSLLTRFFQESTQALK